MIQRRHALTIIGVVLLGGCGGGGGGGGSVLTTTQNTPTNPKYTAGQYLAASTFANQCATPRTGRDPVTNAPYPDTPGSAVFEKFWLRSWSRDLYLWYSELPDLDPTTTTTTATYFAALKTSAITASGAPKDKFHFTYPTTDWE